MTLSLISSMILPLMRWEVTDMKDYILLPHIKVISANAMSSPYTIGFPSMTAWLGFAHALQRKVQAKGLDVTFSETAVSCHQCDMQLYKEPQQNVYSTLAMGLPLAVKGNEWKRASFIESPRCHLDVSVLLCIQGRTGDTVDLILKNIANALHMMKVAGGDIMSFKAPESYPMSGEDGEQKRLLRRLMPGFVLVERRNLVESVNGKDNLETFLDALQVHVKEREDGSGFKFFRKYPGWIVPIAVGFKRLSAVGKVKNQRDVRYDHAFVESILTLGEFKMPYRFESVDEIMWHYEYKPENGEYLCVGKAV